MPAEPQVVVVGSVNQDYLIRVARRPAAGETVTGAELVLAGGGKGANQAIAAARSGVPTALVARVGADPAGDAARRDLAREGVDVSAVRTADGGATGSAFVTVTPDGENQIIVASGANDGFGEEDVAAAVGVIRRARVLLAQMEVPLAAVVAAVAAAGDTTVVILNAAPASPLPAALLARVDILVVNEHEAATVLGRAGAPAAVAAELSRAGPRAVVVTTGGAGAVVAAGGETWTVPAPPVDVVDTTGAGDNFAGTLAATLAAAGTGPPAPDLLHRAVARAVEAASASVTRPGARSPLPAPDPLEKGPPAS